MNQIESLLESILSELRNVNRKLDTLTLRECEHRITITDDTGTKCVHCGQQTMPVPEAWNEAGA